MKASLEMMLEVERIARIQAELDRPKPHRGRLPSCKNAMRGRDVRRELRPEVFVEDVPEVATFPAKKRRAKKGAGYNAAKVRLAWMRADQCAYCGEKADTWDHITPRKRGGDHSDDNLCRVCFPCNAEKTSRELLMFLTLRARRKAAGTWVKRDPLALKYIGKETGNGER